MIKLTDIAGWYLRIRRQPPSAPVACLPECLGDGAAEAYIGGADKLFDANDKLVNDRRSRLMRNSAHFSLLSRRATTTTRSNSPMPLNMACRALCSPAISSAVSGSHGGSSPE